MIGKLSAIETAGAATVPETWVSKAGLRRPRTEELEAMMETALQFCELRSNQPVDKVAALISKSDLWANSTLRYALAKGIRKALAAEPGFRDLYLMGSVIDDQARLNSDIDIILHVQENRADFETWLMLVDAGLLEQFRRRFNPGEGLTSLIDSHVVTDEEVKLRTGYGSLLTSNHTNLTRLS